MDKRITGIEVWQEDLQLRRPYRIAGEEIAHVHNAFILLRDASGETGIGSACPMTEVPGASMPETLNGLHIGRDLLYNSEIVDIQAYIELIESHLAYLPAAHAAVDMALYDLFCKRLGTPVVEFLGRKLDAMETSVTIGITSETDTREQLQRHLRNGFTAIKLKVGDDAEKDIAVVTKVREWGGYGFRLRVDANQGYDAAALQRFLKSTRELQIQLVEQPFVKPGAAEMLHLSEGERALCMADEDLVTEEDAKTLAHGKPYGAWNIKLMKSGGITSVRKMACLAAEAGIRVMWGCNDESRVSIAAALHAAFSSTATAYLDLDGSFDIAHDIVTGGFLLDNGKMKLTTMPGLGVSLR